MSATNWAFCPNCEQLNKVEHEEKVRRLRESYGQVPRGDYEAAMKIVNKMAELGEQTLREDYRVFIDSDLTFQLSYRASCECCKFNFEHNLTIPIRVNQDSKTKRTIPLEKIPLPPGTDDCGCSVGEGDG